MTGISWRRTARYVAVSNSVVALCQEIALLSLFHMGKNLMWHSDELADSSLLWRKPNTFYVINSKIGNRTTVEASNLAVRQ